MKYAGKMDAVCTVDVREFMLCNFNNVFHITLVLFQLMSVSCLCVITTCLYVLRSLK